MNIPNGNEFIQFNNYLKYILNSLCNYQDTEENKNYFEIATKEANEIFSEMIKCYESIDTLKFDERIYELYDNNKTGALKNELSRYLNECIYPFGEIVENRKHEIHQIQRYIIRNGHRYTVLGLLWSKNGYCDKVAITKKIIYRYFPELNTKTPQPKQEIVEDTEDKEEKQTKSTTKKEITDKPKREIDTDKLKEYFISTFKGMGNGNLNHFATMIDELKTDRTGKEFAQIALMIYESNKLNNRKPKDFNKWYTKFCECINCKRTTFRPNQLKPFPESIIKLFSYL